MTETVLTESQLDDYTRERTDTVLIGKSTSTPRLLHIPSKNDPTEVSCKATTDRVGGWYPKPLSVYPPGYFPVCPQCAKYQFGVEVMTFD